jgi:hypothetical protein
MNSEKPEEVRRRIERLFAGPYLELFGRNPNPVRGWKVWGNEIARAGWSNEVPTLAPKQGAGNDVAAEASAEARKATYAVASAATGEDLTIPEHLDRRAPASAIKRRGP